MTALFIDLGNSSIKWAWAEGSVLSLMQSRLYRGLELKDVIQAEWAHLGKPGQVWMVSVAAAKAQAQLAEWIDQAWGLPVQRMASTSRSAGVESGYSTPARLGVDRWAAIIAAHQRYPQGCCVLDCGTATTVDLILQGRHLGGYIVPGFTMMTEALLAGTAISSQAIVPVQGRVGQTPEGGIWLGIHLPIAALAERAIEYLQSAGCCDPGLILTGGACQEVAPLIEITHEIRTALVLEGLLAYSGEQVC